MHREKEKCNNNTKRDGTIWKKKKKLLLFRSTYKDESISVVPLCNYKCSRLAFNCVHLPRRFHFFFPLPHRRLTVAFIAIDWADVASSWTTRIYRKRKKKRLYVPVEDSWRHDWKSVWEQKKKNLLTIKRKRFVYFFSPTSQILPRHLKFRFITVHGQLSHQRRPSQVGISGWKSQRNLNTVVLFVSVWSLARCLSSLHLALLYVRHGLVTGVWVATPIFRLHKEWLKRDWSRLCV